MKWPALFVSLLFFDLQLSEGADPTFLKQPTSKSADKGDLVIFECQISSVAQHAYFWLKDNRNITRGTVSLSGSLSTLQLSSITFSDSGSYLCVVVNSQTGQRWQSGVGTLSVKGKPDIIQPPNVISTYIGQSALFDCVAIGDPLPSVKWKNSTGSVITASAKFEVFGNGSLKIKQLQRSDSGLFICEAWNSYGKTSASVILHVNDPPSFPLFTTRPVNQSAYEGNRVTFYCAASGNPTPVIIWSRLGGLIPAGRREKPSLGSLRIVNIQPDDDGVYICRAQNSQGNITAYAFLRVEGYPHITVEPSDKVAPENSTVQLPCVVEGDPVPTVKWTLPDGNVYNSTSQFSGDIRVLANNSLLISMVQKENAGKYICTAVNKVGDRSISATLTVLTLPRFFSPLSNITKSIGNQLTVECTVYATPTADYQWFFDYSVISRNRTLNLLSLNTSDQGLYRCLANNSLGSVAGMFFLTIQKPPQFVDFPGNQTVGKGKTVSFPCSALGDPTPSVSWYRSGLLIKEDANFRIQSNGTLLLIGVTNEHTGWYTCHASNAAGFYEKRGYLLVADLPVFITKPSNVTLNDGDSVTLPCHAHGPDQPHITWMVQDHRGVIVNVSSNAVVDLTGNLKYMTVSPSERGMHICRACNTAGCSTATAFLDVLFAPSFPVPPKSVGVLQGQDAVLECKPLSSPPAVLTWSGPNKQILSGTGYQYIVRNVQPPDVGEYGCLAENSLGSSDAVIQLSIETTPSIQDFKQVPSSQTHITVQCIVDGTPSPVVTWYLQNTLLPNKGFFPKFDVSPNKQLYVPAGSLANNSFLCNCSNNHGSVAKLAHVPEAPSQITITRVLETAVELSWRQTNPLDLVLQYLLELKSNDRIWKPVNISLHETSALVENLTSFTVFNFRVRAENGLGTGPFSQVSENVTTLEGAPSVPRQLELTVKNASVVIVSWTRPAQLHGMLSSVLYLIRYIPQEGNNSIKHIVQHSLVGSPQNFTLTSLDADTTYLIRVSAGRRRADGIERWSDNVSKAFRTLQLVPLTHPLDLTVAANGPYQIMVKWKIPSYSISGYHICYKEHKSNALEEKVQIPRMKDTVYLIKNLRPNTEYEVKTRMYSNAGTGPFSESIVRTDINAFAMTGGLSSSDDSSGLKVAIPLLVCGLLLLILIIAFACFRRRQASRLRHSFHINYSEDPSLKYVVKSRHNSNLSVGGDSEGSVEGHYNFAQNDDEIDVGMFAGDRNSAHSQDGTLHFLDPGIFDSPSSSNDAHGEGIRLQAYKPRLSPSPTRRKEELDLNRTLDDNRGSPGLKAYSDLSTEKTNESQVNKNMLGAPGISQEPRTNILNRVSLEDSLIKSPVLDEDSLEDEGPPDWLPPPPPPRQPPPTGVKQVPIYAQVDRTRKKAIEGKDLIGDTKNEPSESAPGSNDNVSDENDGSDWLLPPPPTEEKQKPIYAQVDRSQKKELTDKDSVKNSTIERLTNGTTDGATSEEDEVPDWLPPPPPPPAPSSSLPASDSDWERPLPPEILALPGKRNRMAAWAD